MRRFIGLLGIAAILAIFINCKHPEISSVNTEKNYSGNFECTTNLPFLAIENTLSGSVSYNVGHKNYHQKKVRSYYLLKNPFKNSLFRIISHHPAHILSKSTSLFILFHYSQFLWCVIIF